MTTVTVEKVAKHYDVPPGVVRLILGAYTIATAAMGLAAYCLATTP